MNADGRLTDQEIIDTIGLRLFVAEHGDDVWAGSLYWMVKADRVRPLKGGIPNVLARTGTDVALEPVMFGGTNYPLLVSHRTDICRIFERPDGERVVLPLSYVNAVYELLTETDEEGEDIEPDLTFMQGTDPTLPVGLVSKTGTLLAVIMPRNLTR